MDKKSIRELTFPPFTIYDETWALLTSGNIDDHNSMTIAWGGLGTLWHRDVATVYVKPCRYTYTYMEKNDYFALSFFDESHKKALGVMGSKSGRDTDKDKASGLTPLPFGESTIYKEAKLTLICKKIYFNDLLLENIPEVEVKKYYQKETPHRMYVGEVIDVIKN